MVSLSSPAIASLLPLSSPNKQICWMKHGKILTHVPPLRCSMSGDNNELEKWFEQEKVWGKPTFCKDRSTFSGSISTGDNMACMSSEMPDQMSYAPLVSALKATARQNVASFHFPGHNRGRAAPSSLTQLIGRSTFLHDLPELPELDNLFSPEGAILEAQKEAAKLFGSLETWFLVGGTTCGIQAAVMATCSPGDILVLPRNAHISAISAMVLSGIIPKYIVPEYNCEWDIAGGISSIQVKEALDELAKEGRKAAAVLVTSPTYHGLCSNITEISQICHSYGIPLIVDEAHGAHLGFHPQMPRSALQQGADIAVQSTHKVLCSLTQSSMLHISSKLVDRERICRSLQALQSSSPSYLLLASLDAARAQLSETLDTIFDKAFELSTISKKLIQEIPGISVLESSSFQHCNAMDPLRLTVGFMQLGVSAFDADDVLYRDHGLVCELVGARSITFAINLGSCVEHIHRLVTGIKHLSSISTAKTKRAVDGISQRKMQPFVGIDRKLIPREAFFANKRKVDIEKSLGQVCGELICPYPPGIPVMIPGEIITLGAVDYLLYVKQSGAFISGASDPTLSSIEVCEV